MAKIVKDPSRVSKSAKAANRKGQAQVRPKIKANTQKNASKVARKISGRAMKK